MRKLAIFFRSLRVHQMTERRRHGAESFQVTGIKNTMTSVASSSHNSHVSRPGAGLQQQFGREDVPVKTSQYTLLQLVNMVRDNPILYDEELQATMPDVQLKQQKRETWDRIRNDIVWQDVSLVQEVWCDLLDQYSRKTMEMSDSLMEAMRWTDSLINKKKGEPRPSSQSNSMSSGLEKDFYGDGPLTDDVLSGQSIASPSMKYDYVVIQPPTMGHVRTTSHQSIPIQSSQSNTNQFSQRRKTPSPRETEAVVRSYPLDPPKRNINRMTISQDPKHTVHLKKEDTSMNYGRQGLILDVEQPSSSYTSSITSNTKMYKVVSSQRGSTLQIPVSTNRRIHQMSHVPTNIGYDTMPDQLIEPSNIQTEPPKKKMLVHHRNSTIVGPGSSRIATNLPVSNVKMMESAGPLVEDEIIMNQNGEIKMGSTGLIMAPQQSSSSQGHEMNQNMPTTSDDPMHHYHHQDMGDDGGLVDDIGQQDVVGNETSDMAIQYDEDLLFQQHINSVLNRLSDEDKALLKFNMQKIILDARFGPGTARSLLKEDEMLDIVDTHEEIDVGHVPNQDQI